MFVGRLLHVEMCKLPRCVEQQLCEQIRAERQHVLSGECSDDCAMREERKSYSSFTPTLILYPHTHPFRCRNRICFKAYELMYAVLRQLPPLSPHSSLLSVCHSRTARSKIIFFVLCEKIRPVQTYKKTDAASWYKKASNTEPPFLRHKSIKGSDLQ